MRTLAHTREDVDPRALRDLPIFPLPNAVLLPGGVLPLHIFEPRYREMTRDCLAGARTMAIALLRPHEIEEIFPICGIGTIRVSEELPDGRFHLVLSGVARIRIDEELPLDRAYRRVRASFVDATATTRPDVLAKSRPIGELRGLNANAGPGIDAALKSVGRRDEEARFLPLRAGKRDLTVLVDAKTGDVLKLTAHKPWQY